MSDETTPDTVDAEHAARILDDLRSWRAKQEGGESWTARLTFREIDVMLAIADERDALRRQLADMPDERKLERAECEHESWEEYGSGRRCADCKQWLGDEAPFTPSAFDIPAGHALVAGAVVKLAEARAECGREYPHNAHPLGRDGECDGTLDA